MQYYGVDAIVRIVSHLMFIYISFWALQSLRIEQFFKTQFTPQIRMLMVFSPSLSDTQLARLL